MSLGNKLISLRKKAGLSQEEVADKLNVTRQTISKWENDQSKPELVKAKLLSELYCVGYDYLISESEQPFDSTSIEHIVDEIDWTKAWSKKYPILESYQRTNGIENYVKIISDLYDKFKTEYQLNDTDTVLILKDILYHKYKESSKK